MPSVSRLYVVILADLYHKSMSESNCPDRPLYLWLVQKSFACFGSSGLCIAFCFEIEFGEASRRQHLLLLD